MIKYILYNSPTGYNYTNSTNKDGWYIKYSIKVPSISNLPTKYRILSYENFLVEKDNILYKYNPEGEIILDLDDPINYIKKSNAKVYREDIFVTDLMKKDLEKISELSLEHYKKIDSDNDELYRIIFKRDLILMLYNMILYYVHCKNFVEALYLLKLYHILFKQKENERCNCC